jgi:GTPase SAR1 family protein
VPKRYFFFSNPQFRALAPLYARDSKAAVIVFDMTRRTTFENLTHWVSFLRQQGEIPFVIVGNKEDLTEQQQVPLEDATNYAFSVESQFFSASAKTGQNVDLVFKQAQLEAVDMFQRTGPAPNQLMVEIAPEQVPGGGGGCC